MDSMPTTIGDSSENRLLGVAGNLLAISDTLDWSYAAAKLLREDVSPMKSPQSTEKKSSGISTEKRLIEG